jgi:hypothetical protein
MGRRRGTGDLPNASTIVGDLSEGIAAMAIHPAASAGPHTTARTGTKSNAAVCSLQIHHHPCIDERALYRQRNRHGAFFPDQRRKADKIARLQSLSAFDIADHVVCPAARKHVASLQQTIRRKVAGGGSVPCRSTMIQKPSSSKIE